MGTMGKIKSYENETVELNDLISNRSQIIERKLAKNCLLVGPVTLLATPDLIERNFFIGEMDEVLAPSSPPVPLVGCDFSECTFQDVSLLVAPEDMESVRSKLLIRAATY